MACQNTQYRLNRVCQVLRAQGHGLFASVVSMTEECGIPSVFDSRLHPATCINQQTQTNNVAKTSEGRTLLFRFMDHSYATCLSLLSAINHGDAIPLCVSKGCQCQLPVTVNDTSACRWWQVGGCAQQTHDILGHSSAHHCSSLWDNFLTWSQLSSTNLSQVQERYVCSQQGWPACRPGMGQDSRTACGSGP